MFIQWQWIVWGSDDMYENLILFCNVCQRRDDDDIREKAYWKRKYETYEKL